MRPLLLTADLHFTPKHFQWLEAHAQEFQCVVVAGDLCDMFLSDAGPLSNETLVARGRSRETSPNISLADQRVQIAEWLGRIAQGAPVVFCSGNHDGGVWRPKIPGVFGDLSVFESENFVLASSPWLEGFSPDSKIVAPYVLQTMTAARKLATKRRKPLLIVHHTPPSLLHENATRASSLIRQFQPALFACGHDHTTPYLGGCLSFDHKVPCLNPGNPEADAGDRFPAPNHLLAFPPDARGDCRALWNHLVGGPDDTYEWRTITETVPLYSAKPRSL